MAPRFRRRVASGVRQGLHGRVIGGMAIAPGLDPAMMRGVRPFVAPAAARTRSVAMAAVSVRVPSGLASARTATVPPLPPPVIFAPCYPFSGPSRRTSSTMRSVSGAPRPQFRE